MVENEASSNEEWRRWGGQDPFWGVATWAGRERGGEHPWTAEEFYALGLSDWQDFRKHLEAYGVLNHETLLEVGCGAGRLTKHMASGYTRVVGVDVSTGMLETARRHIDDSRIEFRLGNGLALPVGDGSVDVVVSTHVFQHFDSVTIARENFAEIARVLRPGGVTLVHVPMYGFPPSRLTPLTEVLYGAVGRVEDARARARRRRGVPLMRRLDLSWQWLLEELPTLGLTDVEVQMFRTRSNGSLHECVLARRPRATTSA
jgi:SAM-dependent methyltransferase